MRQDRPADLEARVARATEAMVARQRYVSALDVVLAIGWLAPSHLAEWRQGRIECIEQVLQTKPARVAQALRALREWAQRQGLAPNEIAYAARTRDQRPLRFSASGDPALTRRARAKSALSAVVVRWSRARKRYERQGLLVEPAALEEAEAAGPCRPASSPSGSEPPPPVPPRRRR